MASRTEALSIISGLKKKPPRVLPRLNPSAKSQQKASRYALARKFIPERLSADQSVIHPIEPWGKRLVVFNKAERLPSAMIHALKNDPERVVALKRKDLRKTTVDGEPLLTDTVLAICHHDLSPLVYLRRLDFEKFVSAIPLLRSYLESYQKENESVTPDPTYELQQLTMERKTSRKGRQQKGGDPAHPISRGRFQHIRMVH
eukprot:Filipodium_phascolosomae@DN8177_c0_g1_i1.p1